MFDTTLFIVLTVLFSGSVANTFLEYIDEEYGVSDLSWTIITYLFLIIPFGIHKYAKKYKDCKKRNFVENMMESFKSAAKTVAIVDLLTILIGFIPIVGTFVGLVEYIPYIGSTSVWLVCYFIYKIINWFFNKISKPNPCSDISIFMSLTFTGFSIGKVFIEDLIPF